MLAMDHPPWLRVSNQSYFATGRVQFDPAVPNRMWVGAGRGIYFADVPEDATQITWISESRGIEELVANDVVQPSSARLCLLPGISVFASRMISCSLDNLRSKRKGFSLRFSSCLVRPIVCYHEPLAARRTGRI